MTESKISKYGNHIIFSGSKRWWNTAFNGDVLGLLDMILTMTIGIGLQFYFHKLSCEGTKDLNTVSTDHVKYSRCSTLRITSIQVKIISMQLEDDRKRSSCSHSRRKGWPTIFAFVFIFADEDNKYQEVMRRYNSSFPHSELSIIQPFLWFNKKVLLHERKRHTVRRVASARSAVPQSWLGRYPGVSLSFLNRQTPVKTLLSRIPLISQSSQCR